MPAPVLVLDDKTYAAMATIALEILSFVFSMITYLKSASLECDEKRVYLILSIMGFVMSALSFGLMVLAYLFMLFAGNNPNAAKLRTLWWLFARPCGFNVLSAIFFGVARFNVPQPSRCAPHMHDLTRENSQNFHIISMCLCTFIALITGGLLAWLWWDERKQQQQAYSHVENEAPRE